MTECKDHQLPLKYCEKCVTDKLDAYHGVICEPRVTEQRLKMEDSIREYAATIRALQKMVNDRDEHIYKLTERAESLAQALYHTQQELEETP